MQPSRPKMATVVLAVALTIVGLALVFFEAQAIEFVRGLPLPRGLDRDVIALMQQRIMAWIALAASPVLLIIGSLVKGI